MKLRTRAESLIYNGENLLEVTAEQGHTLVTAAEIHAKVHGTAINKWIAVKITRAVGTMWCAYIFALLAFVSLPAAIASKSPIILVSWISTTFLQLVFLPIIIVGQQVLSTSAEERAKNDHETLSVLHQINVTQLAILNKLGKENNPS